MVTFLGIVSFIACNHFRSVYFFIESINSKCPFLAEECPAGVDNYDKFLSGNLDGQCWGIGQARMGNSAKPQSPERQNIVYYSKTSDKASYCGKHQLY